MGLNTAQTGMLLFFPTVNPISSHKKCEEFWQKDYYLPESNVSGI